MTDENLSLCELNILKLSGLDPSLIEQKNVIVSNDGTFIRTNIFGKDKPILVLIHGYGASGPLFYKII